MKVIYISGKAQHGKDTSALYLKEYLVQEGKSVLIAHYGDLLKYICKTFFQWNGEKDEQGRTLLQAVGATVREYNSRYWVSFLDQILNLFSDSWDYVIIPDCRYENEIKSVSAATYGEYHLRVVRSNFESPLTEEQQQHSSETALDDSTPDYYIHNDGTLEDLKNVMRHAAMEVSK